MRGQRRRVVTSKLRWHPESRTFWTIIWMFDHATGWCCFQQATRIEVDNG